MKRGTLGASVLLFLLAAFMPLANAQDPAPPPTTPDDQLGLAPYQSFHGSDIDTVNLSTGNLVVRLPLMSYPQKGSALKLSFSAQYNGKGSKLALLCIDTGCEFDWNTNSSPAGFAVVSDQDVDLKVNRVAHKLPGGTAYTLYYSIMTADGATHYTSALGNITTTGSGPAPSEGQAVDASGWRLFTGGSGGTDTIVTPSGVTYQRASGPSSLGYFPLRSDTNGNMISTTVDATTGVGTILDTIGRHIQRPATGHVQGDPDGQISRCPTPAAPAKPITAAAAWTPPGWSGGSANFTLCYAEIPIYIPDDYPTSPSYGWGRPDPPFTSQMLEAIVLPDGTAWQFEYDDRDPGQAQSINFGSLTKITLPTGGYIKYTYVTKAFGNTQTCGDFGSRWVKTRAVNANDGAGDRTWTYSYLNFISNGQSGSTTVTDPLGDDTVHTFKNYGTCALYETGLAEYEGSSSSGTFRRMTGTGYQSWGIGQHSGTGAAAVPIQTTISIDGKVRKSERDYDAEFFYSGTYIPLGFVTATRDFDYGSNAPGALLRQSSTSYMWQVNSGYSSANLLSLPASNTVLDPSGSLCAATSYGYDDALRGGGNGSIRGNLTSMTKKLSNTPCQAGATWTDVTSYVNHNSNGTVSSATDPRGNTSTYTYDPSLPSAFPSTICNAANECTIYTVDVNTNFLKKIQGPNDTANRLTSYTYDNALRLTAVDYPDGGNTTLDYPDSTTVHRRQLLDTTRWMEQYARIDGLGRMIRHLSRNDEGSWDESDTCYDARGRKAFVSYPYQNSAGLNGSPVCSGAGDAFAYDALSRPLTTVHSDGASIITAYTGAATSVSDEGNGNGRVQRISQVDGLGRLRSVCEVTNTALTMGPAGDLTPSACNQDLAATGFLTAYQYDTLGNLTLVTQGGLNPRSFSYDSFSRLISATNPEAGTTSYAYDGNGNVTQRTRPAPNVTTSGSSVTTAYTYDTVNRLADIGPTPAVSYSDGTTPSVHFAYNQASASGQTLANYVGRKTSEWVTTPGGQTQTTSVFSYDPMGRIVSDWACTKQTCAQPSFYAFTYGYDKAGHVTTETYNNDAGSAVISYGDSYNLAGRLTTVSGITSTPLFSTAHYNAWGALISANLGNGASESLSYYPRGWVQNNAVQNLTASISPGSGSTGSVTITGTERSSTAPGQPATQSTATVTVSGTEQSYVDQECQIVNRRLVCTYTTYYDFGTVSLTANGYTNSTGYNQSSTASSVASGLATAINNDSAAPVTATLSGAVITLTSKVSGAATNYSLSATSATQDTNDFVSASFTATPSGGAMTGGQDAGSGQTTYDAGSVSITVNNYTATAAYGQNSTAQSIAAALATSLNSSPNVTATASGATVTINSRTAGAGTNYSLTAASSSSQSFSPQSFQAYPSGGALTGGSNPQQQPSSYSYALGYSPNGNVQSANDSVNGNWTYSYDAFNRLATAGRSGQAFSYDYDRFGNRWHQNVTAGSGPAPQLMFDTSNRMVGYTYDQAGNLLNDNNGHIYTYDAENRIIKVNGGVENGGVTYWYDAQGRRIRKSVTGTVTDFLYDIGGRAVVELDASKNWQRVEVFAGGKHLATYSNATDSNPANRVLTFNHTDWLGTERLRSNASGLVLETCTSLPFGDGQSCTGSDTSTRHFTGKERDVETGLDFFGARYYMSSVGRFVTPDWSGAPVSIPFAYLAIPQTLNLGTYVGDNPVSIVDRDGHKWNVAGQPGSPGFDANDYGGNTGEGEPCAAHWVPRDPKDPSKGQRLVGDFHGEIICSTNGDCYAWNSNAQRWEKLEIKVGILYPVGPLGAAATRTRILASAMGRSAGRVTIAVTETEEAITLVSSSEKALRASVRALLKDGEIAVEGTGHAEVTGINAARELGLTPTATAASKGICQGCWDTMKELGVKALSWLKPGVVE